MSELRRWVGTSWKMNKTRLEARHYAEGLVDADLPVGVQPFVVPPFTAIDVVRDVLGRNHRVKVGAQNAHWADSGAWTGEVSMAMVKDAGAELVELGHSERRQFFGETDETVNRKVLAALRAGLQPLVCVGEPADVQAGGESVPWVLRQVAAALDRVTADQASQVLLAYEPIWAIGEGGRPAHPDQIAPVHSAVASWCAEQKLPLQAVLYGGSVSHANVAELLGVPGVDGLFVGRAAWDHRDYLALLELAAQA
jgi:L-erythrulose 1-phosphate isomerase